MRLMKHRILFVIFIFSLFWFILLARSFSLQILPQKRLSDLKKQLFEKSVKIQPRRGVIYDRNGKELAISVPSQSLFADPHKIEESYFVAKKLAQFFNKPKKTFLKKILNKKRRFVWIKRHLKEEEVKVIKSWGIKGFHFVKESKRFYTKGSSLSQILGFTGLDGQGLEGIEKEYDDILKGGEQKFILKKDARGRPLFADFSPFINRVSGFDLYLTIDSDLQFYLEKELSNTIKRTQALSAKGLILDAETSEILAMVNVPNYNSNNPLASSPKVRRNRVVTDIFEPGSTMKTFTLASALEKNISPSKTYFTHNGSLNIQGEVITEADKKKKFKPYLNLSEILALSSNIGIAEVALDVGSKKLNKTLMQFGFGQKTGIRFPGESKGILHSLPWRPIKTVTVGFGHGVAVTALQVANAYAVIANGGFLNKPLLVKNIHNPYTGEETHFKKQGIRKVLKEEQAQLLTLMLTSATEKNSTGFLARVTGYLVAGKTGTAQMVDFQKGGYREGEYISSFSGFIPAHNPKFVIYIAIERAKNNFYASSIAAPLFSQIASYSVRKAGLSPVLISKQNLISTKEEQRELVSQKELQNQISSRRLASQNGKVPRLKGLTLREVLKEMKGTGVDLRFYGYDRVTQTIPFAGQDMPSNKKLTVILN